MPVYLQFSPNAAIWHKLYSSFRSDCMFVARISVWITSELNSPSSQVDNIITIAHNWLDNELVWAIKNYKTKNKKALGVDIFISDRYFFPCAILHWFKFLKLCGFWLILFCSVQPCWTPRGTSWQKPCGAEGLQWANLEVKMEKSLDPKGNEANMKTLLHSLLPKTVFWSFSWQQKV